MKVVKCYICDLTWEDEDQVNLHYSLMHMPSCTICGARFKEEAKLKTHIEDHLDSSHSSFVPGINACEKCDDEPKAKTDLRSHIWVSHETGENDEKKIEELNKDNAEHIVSGKDEAKQKSDKRSKKKANKNINRAWVSARNVHD